MKKTNHLNNMIDNRFKYILDSIKFFVSFYDVEGELDFYSAGWVNQQSVISCHSNILVLFA